MREGTQGAGLILDDDDLDRVSGGFSWKEWWEWVKVPSYFERKYKRKGENHG